MPKKHKRSQAGHVRKHLLDVFRYLTSSSPVGTYAKSLLASCSIAQGNLAGAPENKWNVLMTPWTFHLKTSTIRGQQDCTEIVMGARIMADGGALIYQSIPVSVVIKPRCFTHAPPWCKHPHDSALATATRRLHFDFDANVSKWPKHHLQVGGKPGELDAGAYYYAVAEDPSEPRIPTPSLDLVLALDLVMREFDTNLDLPQEATWRRLVIRSEELCLAPYFELARKYLAMGDVPLIEHLSK